jgi:molybdenum cofactor cytidylyltransferase
MLAEVNGRPMIQWVLDLAAEAELDPIVVVLGDDADEIEQRVAWRSERRVRNPDPGRGLSSSVALGLAELGDAERVLVLLGDQPFFSAHNARVITDMPRTAAQPIVVPRYAGVPGNPVLLERDAFPLAASLDGDRGMSQLFTKNADLVRYVDVPGANPDIDTPDELERSVSRA